MSWEVLTGVVEWWADEGLRDVGRRRFHEAKGRAEGLGEGLPRGTTEWRGRVFAAQRLPWRLTEISLGSSDSAYPAVVSWADNATAVLKGSPAEQDVVDPNTTWGDLGLRRMLTPAALGRLVAQPWPTQFRVAGHLLEQGTPVLPQLASLATDYYDVVYDAGLGVLTSWSAVIDGEVAQRISLTQLTAVNSSPSPAPP